jgi:hypothetical protein
MNALTSADISSANDHGVLDSPCEYNISGLAFTADPEGALNGTLDLYLSKDGDIVTLRFLHAHEFEIDAGFPHSYMGLEILDVGFLGWEHSQVRVQGFEDAPGIRFWAQSVSRVDV